MQVKFLLNIFLIAVVIISAVILFQFFGNSVYGYIDTHSLFYWWGFQWFNPGSQTEYGPLIGLISIWLIWHNWQQLKNSPNKSAYRMGLCLILIALTIHVLGYTLQQTRLSIISFCIYMIGSAYLLGGQRWGKIMTFPLFFLLFSMPLEVLIDEFGFHLRLRVIQVTELLCHTLGIEVIRNGTQLFDAHKQFTYDVAPACSGIRSLVALLALCMLFGYLQFQSLWRRLLFLCLAFPFAFIGNVIRIFLIIIIAAFFGQSAGNIAHEWFGFIVFVTVIGCAMITGKMLHCYLPEKVKDRAIKTSLLKDSYAYNRYILLVTLVIILAVTLSILFIGQAQTVNSEPSSGIYLAEDKQTPIALPPLLDFEWYGATVPVSDVERNILPKDTGFSKMQYINLDDPLKRVSFSIVLSGKDRSSIHRPEICLVGQGWSIPNKFTYNFIIPDMPNELSTTVLRVERMGVGPNGEQHLVPGLFAYWFVGNGVVVASHWGRILYMTWNRLFTLKNHRWAYIYVQTDCLDGEEAALGRLQEVIGKLVPPCHKSILNETQVKKVEYHVNLKPTLFNFSE